MIRVVLSKDARQDLRSIFRYWAERASFEVAERIVDRILERFGLIAKFPELGRHSDEISEGLLRITAGQYVIYFRKVLGNIRVLRILHGARDQKLAFRPE
jgi:toxin ParE1/3/4